MRRAAIAGTGLIGTSIALGLCEAGWDVTGWDPDPAALSAAEERGAVTSLAGFDDLIASGSDLILISAPLAVTVELLGALDVESLVIDVASVKTEAVAAGAHLDHFVGTHPMAGREVSGPSAASPALFHGAAWVITSDGANANDVASVEEIVALLGARPLVMTAAEHDAGVARVSHLPQIVAGALMLEAAATPSSLDLAAGSFRDLTRVAASDPRRREGVLAANAAEVAAAIDGMRSRLDQLEHAVWEGGSELHDLLALARAQREALGAAAVPVRVALADRPGELAKVGHSLETSAVDVRDIQLRHAPYGGGGVLTISVRDEDADSLRAALLAEGLLLLD